MKQFFFLLTIVLFITSCGGDDDGDLGRITFIGRDAGWVIASINSDLGEKSSAAVAATSDEDIAMTGQTRAEVEQQFIDLTLAETSVDNCDRDDVLFFLDNGQMRIIQGAEVCPEAGDPTVLMGFNDNFYSSDLGATMLVIRSDDGVELETYTVEELNASTFSLRTTRTFSNLLVGSFTYEVSYTLQAN
ncbi:hypothetical protein [Neolewinella agarilytica]|uniref:hypothetical protein n=1 Tax=Neolewinella agarilytica TaxID=478744 RepID=UPI00235205BA|nr:hypothetical protein [Neolewinella agarilytica]